MRRGCRKSQLQSQSLALLALLAVVVPLRGQEDDLASRVEMLVWETRFGGVKEAEVRVPPRQVPEGTRERKHGMDNLLAASSR